MSPGVLRRDRDGAGLVNPAFVVQGGEHGVNALEYRTPLRDGAGLEVAEHREGAVHAGREVGAREAGSLSLGP